MNPTIQVACEIQVELSRFYNIDLFHRGFYQIRISLESQNCDRRLQLSLDHAVEPLDHSPEKTAEGKGSRTRRVQCPILPARVINDGQTAVSKTFLILYKQDCINLNDVFKFRVDFLQPTESIEELFVKSGVALKVEMYFADEDEPQEEESLWAALKNVAQRTVHVHANLRNGLHSYIPCTFDYYHLGTMCMKVHATLLAIQLPEFRIINSEQQQNHHQTSSSSRSRANGTSSSSSSRSNGSVSAPIVVPIDDAAKLTFENVLFASGQTSTSSGPTSSAVSNGVNEKYERNRRAYERYAEICGLLLGSQESLRRQLFELKRLVPNAIDVSTSSGGLAARLEAMCDTIKVLDSENELVESVAADLAQLSAEIRLLWSHYLSIVTLNPLVTQFYAVRYQQQRVRRFAEGFLTIEYRKILLLEARERTLIPHEELASMIRSSDYFQALQPLPLECVEMDGSQNTLPVIFEESFFDDNELRVFITSPAATANTDGKENIDAAISACASLVLDSQALAQSEKRGRSVSDLTQCDGSSIASGSTAASLSNSSNGNSPSTSSRSTPKASSATAAASQPAYTDILFNSKERQRTDLLRIAHAANSRVKQKQYAVSSQSNENGNANPKSLAKGKSKSNGGRNLADTDINQVALVGYRKLDTALEQPIAIGSLNGGHVSSSATPERYVVTPARSVIAPTAASDGPEEASEYELELETAVREIDTQSLSTTNAVVVDEQAAANALGKVVANRLMAAKPRLFELKQARSRSRLDLRAAPSPTHSEHRAALSPALSVWQLDNSVQSVNGWLSLPDLASTSAAAARSFDRPLAAHPRVKQHNESSNLSDEADGTQAPEEKTLTISQSASPNESSSSRASDEPAKTSPSSTSSETKTATKKQRSNDVLGILEMLGEDPNEEKITNKRKVTTAEILASRSKDLQRVDYLQEFEQRARLGSADYKSSAFSITTAESTANNSSAQRSIVSAVPDQLVRFIRLKEEFKRKLARVYAGHVYSDHAFVAATCPYFWAPPSSSKLLSPQPPTDPGLHLVVCVHGMDGFAHDLRSARIALEQTLPATRFDFLMSKKNQRATSQEFDVLGERLVSEILQHIDSRGAMPARISFLGFSLGNVIIRTALASPGLRHLLPKLYTFVSLAGPHLGVLYQTSALVGVGTWLVRKWKKSESLMQLCLKDHGDPRQTFMYRLSRCTGLSLFRYVLLVSSPQDHYVPRHSARIELAASVVRDSGELGRVYVEMLANLLSPIASSTKTQLVRFDAVFALPHDTNAFIGRAAHCAVMENELFLEKFFSVSAAKYFR